MPEREYHCACGEEVAIFYAVSDYPWPTELRCRCGGALRLYFKRAPGMVPDIWNPYHDQQLGITVSSRAQLNQHLKEKNLAPVSTEEFNRKARDQAQPDEMKWDSKKWHESAQKAYNDLYYGNVEVPATPSVDTAQALVSNTEK